MENRDYLEEYLRLCRRIFDRMYDDGTWPYELHESGETRLKDGCDPKFRELIKQSCQCEKCETGRTENTLKTNSISN